MWKVNTCKFLKKPEQFFECPDGYGVSRMKSKYYKSQNDRLWEFNCLRIADTFSNDCYWTGGDDYVNKPDLELKTYCNTDERYVMAGIKSFFVDLNGDRKWNIKCCRNTNAIINECKSTTTSINQLQQDIDYEVNLNHVFTGFESHHNNYFE